MNYSVVFVTAPQGKEAETLARLALEKRLCACVNIIRDVRSFFWWEGKIDEAHEALLVMKTEQKLVKNLVREIRKVHSYKVCEILALPVVAGSKPYLEWVSASVSVRKPRKGQSL